jgi:hypothetical protein
MMTNKTAVFERWMDFYKLLQQRKITFKFEVGASLLAGLETP